MNAAEVYSLLMGGAIITSAPTPGQPRRQHVICRFNGQTTKRVQMSALVALRARRLIYVIEYIGERYEYHPVIG